jgi:hypothetical protein
MGTVSRHNVHTIGMQSKANYFTFVLAEVALNILLPLKNNTNGSHGVNNFRSTIQKHVIPSVQSSVTEYIIQAN